MHKKSQVTIRLTGGTSLDWSTDSFRKRASKRDDHVKVQFEGGDIDVRTVLMDEGIVNQEHIFNSQQRVLGMTLHGLPSTIVHVGERVPECPFFTLFGELPLPEEDRPRQSSGMVSRILILFNKLRGDREYVIKISICSIGDSGIPTDILFNDNRIPKETWGEDDFLGCPYHYITKYRDLVWLLNRSLSKKDSESLNADTLLSRISIRCGDKLYNTTVVSIAHEHTLSLSSAIQSWSAGTDESSGCQHAKTIFHAMETSVVMGMVVSYPNEEGVIAPYYYALTQCLSALAKSVSSLPECPTELITEAVHQAESKHSLWNEIRCINNPSPPGSPRSRARVRRSSKWSAGRHSSPRGRCSPPRVASFKLQSIFRDNSLLNEEKDRQVTELKSQLMNAITTHQSEKKLWEAEKEKLLARISELESPNGF